MYRNLKPVLNQTKNYFADEVIKRYQNKEKEMLAHLLSESRGFPWPGTPDDFSIN